MCLPPSSSLGLRDPGRGRCSPPAPRSNVTMARVCVKASNTAYVHHWRFTGQEHQHSEGLEVKRGRLCGWAPREGSTRTGQTGTSTALSSPLGGSINKFARKSSCKLSAASFYQPKRGWVRSSSSMARHPGRKPSVNCSQEGGWTPDRRSAALLIVTPSM